jgi:hypothetical protein
VSLSLSKAARAAGPVETLLLCLLLSRYFDDSAAVKWCNDVVEDDGRFIECARDGVEWQRPRHWFGVAGLPDQLRLFTKNVTQAELLGIAQAAALYDGDGRTDVPTSLGTLKVYLSRLTSKDPKVVLMGPGGRDVKNGGMQRLTDLVPRVAHKYLDEREKMRACFRAGVEARGADAAARGVPDGGKSPTKTEVKEKYKQAREQLVQEQTQHNRTKHALSSAHARAKVQRENLRACVARERNKAHARGAGDLLAERNAAHALIKVYLAELVVLRNWKNTRAARSDPVTLRKLEEERAELGRVNKALSLENYKLGEKKVQNDVEFAKAKQFADSVWLPQRQVGTGAGRGCAHDPLVRKLYMKLLTLRVSPSIMNEVSARTRAGPRARAPGRPHARRTARRGGPSARRGPRARSGGRRAARRGGRRTSLVCT